MKLYDVCIRGFIKGNLGDDLFIDILCRRYPNSKFVICAEKAYKKCFSDIPNLKYISHDSLFTKFLFRLLKMPTWCANMILSKCGAKKRFAYWSCEWLMQCLSRENVLISGSIFMEPQEELWKEAYHVREMRYYKKKPYVIGCNFGPYHNEGYREFYQECFKNAKQVCFRETYSYKKFVGENIQWGPDIVFTYPKISIQPFSKKDYVVISVLDLNKDLQKGQKNIDGYIDSIADAVKELTRQGERVIFLGFCNSQGDDKVINKICERWNNSELISIYNYPTISYKEALGIIANAKAIISTRYHGMILGWLFGKKVLPLVYSSKMQHVIDDIQCKIPVCNVYDSNFSGVSLMKAYEYMMKNPYALDIDEMIKSANVHFEKLDRLLK